MNARKRQFCFKLRIKNFQIRVVWLLNANKKMVQYHKLIKFLCLDYFCDDSSLWSESTSKLLLQVPCIGWNFIIKDFGNRWNFMITLRLVSRVSLSCSKFCVHNLSDATFLLNQNESKNSLSLNQIIRIAQLNRKGQQKAVDITNKRL